MRALSAIGIGIALLGSCAGASAIECPGNPDAIGTSRVMTIDALRVAHVGTMQYPNTLPLAEREVVLTFDDGPMPPYTNRILDVLAAQCVKANYFIIGRMARGYPDLLKRIYSDGHVVGTHSENHLLGFDKMALAAVKNEIEQGIVSVGTALGEPTSVAPFFRIPGLLRSDAVDNYLRSRQLVTFSADVAGDDWRHIPARDVVRRIVTRLDEKGRGIILLHDIQPATAMALPNLLKELKARGYRIVQVRPTTAAPVVAANGVPPTQKNAAPLASAWPTAMAPPRPKEVVARTQTPAQVPAQVQAKAPAAAPRSESVTENPANVAAPPQAPAVDTVTAAPANNAPTPEPPAAAALASQPTPLELTKPEPEAPAADKPEPPQPAATPPSMPAPTLKPVAAANATPVRPAPQRAAPERFLAPSDARPLAPMLKPATAGVPRGEKLGQVPANWSSLAMGITPARAMEPPRTPRARPAPGATSRPVRASAR